MSAVITEAWKPVIGYEGLYEASTRGRIRSLHRATPRILTAKPASPTDPHLRVTLCKDGTQKCILVHRLVAAAFHGPCPVGLEVRHLDGDAQNNRPSNLRYGTRSENVQDAVAHGTHNMASKTECPEGHQYDTLNTYVSPAGKRSCRICRARSRRKYLKRVAA